MSVPPPGFDYPFPDFLRDLAHLESLELPAAEPFPRMLREARAYFHERYPVRSEAAWKVRRFLAVLTYYGDHVDDFDRGDLSVYGSPSVGALVGVHLLEALHTLMIADRARALGNLPAPAEVIELARRIRDRDREAGT